MEEINEISLEALGQANAGLGEHWLQWDDCTLI